MLNRKVIFIWFLLVTARVGFGYPTWIKVYDGHGLNTVKFVLPLETGHTIFAATCDSTPTWDGTWAAEIDENGDILWNYYNENRPQGLAEIEGEGYLLLTGLYSGELVRLDLSGNEVWSIPVGYSAAGIVRTSSGHFVYRDDSLIRMIDKDGNTIWTVNPPQPDYIAILGPSFCPSGGFAANGSRYDPSKNYFMGGTADSLGVFDAVGEYDGGYRDLSCLGTYSDYEGNCYGVAQYSSGFPPPTSDEYVVRFDSNGDLNWWTIIPNTVAICQSADGNPVIAGLNNVTDISGFFIRKMDPANGSYFWQVIQGNGDDAFNPYCIASASDGGFVVGGWSIGMATIAKTDSLGLINGMGMQETEESVLYIQPSSNPSYSSSVAFDIQVPADTETQLHIFNAAGRLVHSAVIHDTGTVVSADMCQMPAGVYTAVLSSESSGRTSCRVVVLNQTQ